MPRGARPSPAPWTGLPSPADPAHQRKVAAATQPVGPSRVLPYVTIVLSTRAPRPSAWRVDRGADREGLSIDPAHDRVPGIDIPALYAAHRLSLVRLAALLVDDRGLAEDIVQDAFIGLTRHRHQVRDPQAALGYLRTSVVNGSRSMLRRRRTVTTFLARSAPPEDVAPADAAVLAHERQDRVLLAVRDLPPRMREVLVLRYWSDLTETQIAAALGISEGTVKSTASRALDKLGVTLGGLR